MARVPILSFPETETPPELRAQVLALQDDAWPSSGPRPVDPSPGSPVHDPALRPVSVLSVAADGTVRAALDVLRTELWHAGARWAVGGLSTVVTRRAERGRGHGGRLAAAGRALMVDEGLDLGLFTCDRPLRGFYEGAGWVMLPGTVLVGGTVSDPFPSDAPGFAKVTMSAFFTPAARAAASGFRHARVGLYPGAIDRLW
ncbi:GNAT family N-acetyltransferase (plasmid) [Streptomyces sp. BI20]|uniref:GNAT family N-acetyltransferase n=1 Tax=Streptomyces sp. BI20 TaxID=3403460 RepID=UPI003C75D6AB